MTCPACGYANHTAAPFCMDCGAAISLNNDEGASFAPLAPTQVAPVASKSRPSLRALSPLRWSMEARIVVALLLLLVGFQFMVNRGVAAESASYDAARAAMAHQQWHTAATALAPLAASGFRDASAQLAAANKQVAAFDTNWQAGLKASATGDDWLALQSYKAAATIEPTYSGLPAQIAATRTALGQIVYRLPATGSSHGGLWLADADGGNAMQLPGSDVSSRIFAIDPIGDRLLYASLITSATLTANFSLDFHLYHTTLHTDRQLTVPITGTVLFSRYDLIASYQAAFFGGSLVISEGGFGDRSDAPGGFRGWVFDNVGHMREFHAALIARPAPTDAALYFVDGNNAQSDAILAIGSYTSGISDAHFQQVVGKTVTHVYVVNQQLLYSTYNQSAVAIYLTLTAPTDQEPRQLLKLPSAVADITYSNQALYIMVAPDGRSAFITLPNGQNYILNLGSSLLYGLSNLPAGGHTSVRFASFSPDSQRLLIAGGIFYSAMSPSSEGPRYDWLGVSDLSGNIGHVARFNGSIDGAGFLNTHTIYYYRSPGLGGLDNYSEVVVSPINALKDATPALPNLNLQATGNWLPYPLTNLDSHTLLLAGKVGNDAGVYAYGTSVGSKLGTDYIGSSGSIHSLVANATSVWLLKSGQISPAGLP